MGRRSFGALSSQTLTQTHPAMQTPAFRAGFAFTAFLILATGCAKPANTGEAGYDPAADSLRFAGEHHLRNIRQLTFGGNNAEAYWSPDGKQLTFQSDFAGLTSQGCDQIFVMNADGTALPSGATHGLVSTGTGRTTCSYFLPNGRVLFASTHASGVECPQAPMFEAGRYVWAVYAEYDIYSANPDGSDVQPLITGPGYDAEATVSPDGRYVLFTSTRNGDLDLYRYDLQTAEVLQLTNTLGYDGGAFFSPDSKKIVWRADRPEGEAAQVYTDLLAKNFVEPSALNIWVADVDGSNPTRVTNLPGANWAPFFTPDATGILFASNHHMMDQGGRQFAIFLVNLDGTGLTQITHSGTFEAFPMFSPDGTQLVFASNRNVSRTESRDTNIFVAEWVEQPTEVDLAFGQ